MPCTSQWVRLSGLVLSLCLVWIGPAAAARAAIDLEGSWYLLVHYRDSSTANPDVDRWDDKLWTFKREGSRLRWTEYPIVVFEDQTGRFGRVGRNPRARILHAWEPNEAQQTEIANGLQANKRGTKTKTLRGSDEKGYKSTGGSRSMSAMTVGYQETWRISDVTSLPIFTRDDIMGTEAAIATGSSKNMSGRTQYAAIQVSPDGNVISGRFARDENRAGTFRLVRAGAPRNLESDGRTPNEKQRDRMQEAIQAGIQDEAYRQFLQSLDESGIGDAQQRIGVDELDRIWRQYEPRVIGGDRRATQQLGEAVTEAYAEAVSREYALKLVGEDASVEELIAGLPERDRVAAEKVRAALGSRRIAELRARYADRIAAGDEEAIEAVRREIEAAYADVMRQEFNDRLSAGDAQAMRELREYQRQERDRRP